MESETCLVLSHLGNRISTIYTLSVIKNATYEKYIGMTPV